MSAHPWNPRLPVQHSRPHVRNPFPSGGSASFHHLAMWTQTPGRYASPNLEVFSLSRGRKLIVWLLPRDTSTISTSMSQNSWRCGCWSYDTIVRLLSETCESVTTTLMATRWPLFLNFPTCTWARLATPMGLGSNSSNRSSMEHPISDKINFSRSSYAVGTHWSCSGLIVLVHSTGSTTLCPLYDRSIQK